MVDQESIDIDINEYLKKLNKLKSLCIRGLVFQYLVLILAYYACYQQGPIVFVYVYIGISVFYSIVNLLSIVNYKNQRETFHQEFSQFIPWWQLQKYGGWK